MGQGGSRSYRIRTQKGKKDKKPFPSTLLVQNENRKKLILIRILKSFVCILILLLRPLGWSLLCPSGQSLCLMALDAALVHLSPSGLPRSLRARPVAFIGFQSGRGGPPLSLSSGLLCLMALDAALVHLSPSGLPGSLGARPVAFIGVQSGRGGPPGWIHDDSDRPRWRYSPGSFLVF